MSSVGYLSNLETCVYKQLLCFVTIDFMSQHVATRPFTLGGCIENGLANSFLSVYPFRINLGLDCCLGYLLNTVEEICIEHGSISCKIEPDLPDHAKVCWLCGRLPNHHDNPHWGCHGSLQVEVELEVPQHSQRLQLALWARLQGTQRRVQGTVVLSNTSEAFRTGKRSSSSPTG